MHVLNVNYLIESSTLKLVKIAKEIKYITCSVPQESIGTLLFSVYVIDLTNASRLLDLILISYDSNLFLIIRTFFTVINKETLNIKDWFTAKKLSLNGEKTKYSFIHEPIKKDNIPYCLSKLILNNYKMTRIYQVPWRFISPILNFRAQQ